MWGSAGSCGAACANNLPRGELFQPLSLFNRLPEYSSEPSCLSPSHCRLCLKLVASASADMFFDDLFGVAPSCTDFHNVDPERCEGPEGIVKLYRVSIFR